MVQLLSSSPALVGFAFVLGNVIVTTAVAEAMLDFSDLTGGGGGGVTSGGLTSMGSGGLSALSGLSGLSGLGGMGGSSLGVLSSLTENATGALPSIGGGGGSSGLGGLSGGLPSIPGLPSMGGRARDSDAVVAKVAPNGNAESRDAATATPAETTRRLRGATQE